MISWKQPFERLNEEYEMTKKKKQALDNLLDAGRISQSTYDLFKGKMDETIAEIEEQQRALLEKMNSKAEELEQHVKTLEMLLANFEIRHVTGEIDEDVYQRESTALSTGLETARQELDTVKEAVNQLSSNTPIQTTDVALPQEIEPQTVENVEMPEPQVENVDEPAQVVEFEKTPEEIAEQNLPEPSDETEENIDSETIQDTDETEETWQDTDETEETWQDTDETEEITQDAEETESMETESMETESMETESMETESMETVAED